MVLTLSSFEIAVPSNRPWVEVGANLIHLKNQSECYGLKILISDNSADDEKREHLDKLTGSNFRVSFIAPCEAIENWSNALKQCSAEFIQFLADDDILSTLGPSKWQQITVPESVVGISPVCLLSSPPQGLYGFRQFEIDSDTPIGRISQYGMQSQGANTILYASWRKSLLQTFFDGAGRYHPCGAGYQDWSVTRALLAEGKVLSDPSLIYVYQNDNWFGPEEATQHEIERLFIRSGMAPKLLHILPVLKIFDDCVFLLRKVKFRLELSQRFILLNALIKKSMPNLNQISVGDFLEALLSRISVVSPLDAEKYERFMRAVIDEESLKWRFK